MSNDNQTGKSSRPNADEKRKPNQPKYQPVEQADDEEIALTQRQSRRTNPADETPKEAQVSGEDQEDDLGEEEWMDEEGNDISPEDLKAEEDARELSGGHRSQRTRRRSEAPRP